MSLFTMLEAVGTLYRSHSGRDASQGTTQTFVVVACNFACSAQQMSANRQQAYAQMEAFVTTTIYTQENIGAQPNDKIRVKDRAGNYTYYNVQGMCWNVGRTNVPWQTPCEFIQMPVGLVDDQP